MDVWMDHQEWAVGDSAPSPGSGALTQADATVLQQVAQVVEHGALVLPADATEVAEETAAACHHLGEADLLGRQSGPVVSACPLDPPALCSSSPTGPLPWIHHHPRGHSP